MKHIFVINPVAGKKNVTEKITNELEELKKIDDYKDLNYEIYNTKCVGDATNFVRETCEHNESGEDLRFYACGGDGTINEVVNGLYGQSNASFSCVPCGSGNDFVKVFKDVDFKNIRSLIDGSEKTIDLMKANGQICINIANIGFDAAVAYNMVKFKRWPLVTGKGAYNLGLIKSLFSERRHYADIYIDEEKIDLTGFLLACACNGICCGGSYYCSPKSVIDDGFIDCIAIKHMSLFKFIGLVKYYQNGTYQENPKVMKYIKIYKAKKLKIVSFKKDIIYCLDGECYKAKEVDIEIIPQAVKIVIPKQVNCPIEQ